MLGGHVALALLDEAVAKRSNGLIFPRQGPRLRVLHARPRQARLLARVGLNDTALAAYER